ncbi:hypothetical protein [Paenibacillus roseipurpureus]|uniref:Uncharacterized protein n=1 Tax=Paenibacillus roseopurpureus TaxID=2918901 RepID=A0AA96RN48_9BACL|nr:hypothetical protein [Paenibacillus sp. MBLB1832]WNR45022.1 hypothetical protein MJB10_02390 [Paenibacillus sp. MBLB1832]
MEKLTHKTGHFDEKSTLLQPYSPKGLTYISKNCGLRRGIFRTYTEDSERGDEDEVDE